MRKTTIVGVVIEGHVMKAAPAKGFGRLRLGA
jgi:hypothetical protein